MNETADQNWNTRALDRQIGTLYYERLLASKDHQPVRDEAAEKTAALQASPREFIRDPVLLEFLGLPGTGKLLESKLEDALLDNLQSFLLELGKDHTVVRYSVLHDHAQLFASKYRLVLPSEEELRSELIREQEMLAGQIETGPPTPRRKPAPKRRKPKGGQP